MTVRPPDRLRDSVSTADEKPLGNGQPEAGSARPTRVRWLMFALLFVLFFLNFIDRSTLSISLPSIVKEYKLSPEFEGVILGSFFWTYLVFQIPGGFLLDKLGLRKVVTGASMLWGIFQILGGLATGGVFLLVTRLGLGAAEAPMAPSTGKFDSVWLPTRERSRGATILDAASPFGSAIGALLITFIIGTFGTWRWAFAFTGALTILASLLYYAYSRDTPSKHKRVNAAELADIEAGGDPVSQDGPQPRAVDFLRSRSFWAMMFGRLGWAAAWWGVISWTPTYLVNAMHFNLSSLGFGTSAVFAAGVLGDLVAGVVADRWRRTTGGKNNLVLRVLFGVSGVGAAASIFALPATHNGGVAVVLLASSVFFICFGGLYWAIPALLVPKAQVGRVGGVMNIASSAGGSLAPIVMGFAIAAEAGSFVGSFVVLGFCATLYLVGSLLIDYNRPMARLRAERALP